jgi:cyclopropane fatty-acyl-phospholipid synthase-like methyltransferase
MSNQSHTWSAIDQTETPSHCVSYLHTVSALESVSAYKRMTYALLEATPGSTILDVGCGAGDDVRALGELVGPHGRVVGVDNSAAMIAVANTRANALTAAAPIACSSIWTIDDRALPSCCGWSSQVDGLSSAIPIGKPWCLMFPINRSPGNYGM